MRPRGGTARREVQRARGQKELREQGRQTTAAADTVRALLGGNRLSGCDDAVFEQAMGALQDRMSYLVPLATEAVLRESTLVRHTVASANAAARYRSQAPERTAKALKWLMNAKFLHCGELLQATGLLDRLGELKTTGPGMLKSWNIPIFCCDGIYHAARRNGLSGAMLAPAENSAPPGGIQRALSSSRCHTSAATTASRRSGSGQRTSPGLRSCRSHKTCPREAREIPERPYIWT